MHAAILLINQALEQKAPPEELIKLLRSLNAGLENVEEKSKGTYRTELIEARTTKAGSAGSAASTEEKDYYDTNLTQTEIQKIINMVNAMVSAENKRVAYEAAIRAINVAINNGDATKLGEALEDPAADLTDVDTANAFQYQVTLSEMKGGNDVRI